MPTRGDDQEPLERVTKPPDLYAAMRAGVDDAAATFLDGEYPRIPGRDMVDVDLPPEG